MMKENCVWRAYCDYLDTLGMWSSCDDILLVQVFRRSAGIEVNDFMFGGIIPLLYQVMLAPRGYGLRCQYLYPYDRSYWLASAENEAQRLMIKNFHFGPVVTRIGLEPAIYLYNQHAAYHEQVPVDLNPIMALQFMKKGNHDDKD